MQTALLLLVVLLLIYLSWQISRAADGRFVKQRLDELEGKLDAILMLSRGNASAD